MGDTEALFSAEIPRNTGPPSTIHILFNFACFRELRAEGEFCGLLFDGRGTEDGGYYS